MQLVAVSDTHWKLDELKLPKGDIFVFAGDWSVSNGGVSDAIKFANYVHKLKFKHKLVIAGNHDFAAQHESSLVKQLFKEAGAIYLQDESVVIDGLKFWGSPWSPEFMNWAFMKPDYELTKVYNGIDPDTDILITHTPPYGTLDRLPSFENVGSHALEDAVHRVKPSVHIFGHIHCGYGVEYSDNTVYYNVSVCDDNYNLVNKPTVLEV